jgi:Recombination endonuclease VII
VADAPDTPGLSVAVTRLTRKRPIYDPAKRRQLTLARFGLTAPDYARLFLSQNSACGICQRQPSGRALDVDHDHRSKVIRGLLCHRCNRGLGFFSSEAVQRIADYLARPATGYVIPKRKRRQR